MMADKERNHEVTVIGIAGSTGSGKTMVVREIIEALPFNHVAVVPLDSYYNDISEMIEEERHATNFDRLDVFDWKLLIKQTSGLREGKPIRQPTYSYLKCNHPPRTVHVEPRLVIVIEDIMTLLSERPREMMDLKVFVDCDLGEWPIRNIQRNTIKWGRDVSMVVRRYLDVLRPIHKRFIEPVKRSADVITPQGEENPKSINISCKYAKYLVLVNLS